MKDNLSKVDALNYATDTVLTGDYRRFKSSFNTS